MASCRISRAVQCLRRTAFAEESAGLTDGQLLTRFIQGRDEAAFEALVGRHGPMVFGVCRRVLGNAHDAEDAFQAAFLVLVQKAASIRHPNLLANWLYGVAHTTALRAKVLAARRRSRERQVTDMPEPAAGQGDEALWRDLQPLLDQELARLPENYRAAVVLCDLEGKTHKEAARQLGLPQGTVSGRLSRARAMLARRLTKRGLAVSGGSLAVLVSRQGASASVPAAVVSSTVKVATLLAAGQQLAAGPVSTQVAALMGGVLRIMLLKKLRIVSALLLVGVLACGAATLATRSALAEDPPGPPTKTKPLRGRVVAQPDKEQEQLRGA
jgi:RNA polymerase sigma factor (sigma-70 family)